MAEDEHHRKDPVPAQVGEGRKRFNIIRTAHLGSGHFGDVYMGTHYSTMKKVAVKLEHRSGSIARREWEVMRAMDGDGVPAVYYTGMSGRYYVMVMDLLGPTLQRILESSPNRNLPWETVSAIGTKCVELLRKLHRRGYVHGDVKPENFLCAFRDDSNSAPRDGLFMVDLGLASKWADPSLPGGHISYGQRIDHFSGTVRYASVNAHLGRWLSRRDDLESLGYMLLYLFNGSLPWQGYCGDDKNMHVCETKGRLTVDVLCRSAPEVMQYYLAYVRALKFEEAPDYDYLMLVLDHNRGMKEIRKLLTLKAPKDSPPAGNGSVSGAASVGSKRKRGDDAEDADSQALKKHKVVVPKRIKTHQWVIVSTSSRTGNSPHTQCYTSHTTYANLAKEVEKKWSHGMRITSLNFAGQMWTAVLNAQNSGYLEQALHYCPESEFPRDWVRRKWDEGFFITSVAGNDNCWGVVCSTMQRGRKYKQQSYIVSATFPSKWVSEKWAGGYFITAIATQGCFQQQWCVVMSRGAPYKDQCVELDFGYPSESIHYRWDENYMITAIACTQDQSAYVLSRGHCFGEEQRATRTSHGPLHKIREDWNDLLYVSCLAYGRV
ncbi:Casein kinase 1-like protein HD16 [Porphyridium purpureum]|uniref:non-specific serine/threonine protein kinase n=1 Tax=Porphyridium purpureum TaxID=35688 RepID=A0A5J4YTY4_PORPP|nr:Casein kinase 1-like protein HD16 [Porphyridium purpureum]|eukprot:POR8935..scf227_4